jgi:hypothetical protein
VDRDGVYARVLRAGVKIKCPRVCACTHSCCLDRYMVGVAEHVASLLCLTVHGGPTPPAGSGGGRSHLQLCRMPSNCDMSWNLAHWRQGRWEGEVMRVRQAGLVGGWGGGEGRVK